MKLPFYIYIPEYSQYWFQHALINLITTRREFTLFQYSKTLSSIITSFCIIFNICYMMNQQYYIYSRILPVLISKCCIEFNSTRREFTLLQYSKTLSSIITSFCIIFDFCKMMKLPFYIYIPEYSQYWFQHAVINLITTRREFTLFQYSKKLSSIITSFCIIFNICYMMNQQYYIYSRILPVLISKCCIEFNSTRREFTLLQYSKTLSSIITSFCIIFDFCKMMKLPFYIYIPEYSQYWFQHAVINLITTRREFTLFQYSKKLSSIITSFCIIFNICYMMNQQYYIYSRTLPVLISKCCIEFNSTRREFTLLQYSTTLSSIITSFCIIFYICNILNYRFIYIPEYSQYWFQHAVLNLITTRREFTLLQYSKTLSSIIASFCIIFDICYMMN